MIARFPPPTMASCHDRYITVYISTVSISTPSIQEDLSMKNIAFRKQLLALSVLSLAAGTAQAAEITVSAAASLTNAFKEIAQRYEAKYPDAKVQLNFGASGALLQQMAKGAPVDVFASADQATMDKAEKQDLINPRTRHNFARNTLVLIVPADSTQSLDKLADLKKASIQKIAIGNPASVPVGNYTKEVLEDARLWKPVSTKAVNAQNVRQSLDYVARGEVDAGFVYGTDTYVMKDKVKTAFEVPTKTPILYPLAITKDSAQPEEARRFQAFVLAPEGQEVLARFFFKKP
ncbi:MAG: molybdate ABC transporter substrate-binding protein [Lautropia mirabilis]|nr:molybdate ABC transporter substrate-binding protein [Lautropia mirabilis]